MAAPSKRDAAWFHKYCCVSEVTQLCLTSPSYLGPPFSSALTCCRYKTLLAMATWPNKSQQWREAEVSAACQTKLCLWVLSNLCCTTGSVLFTPGIKLSLSPVVVFWKAALGCALHGQQICRTFDSKLCAHESQSKRFKRDPFYQNPLAVAINFFFFEWSLRFLQNVYWKITFSEKKPYVPVLLNRGYCSCSVVF